MSTAPPAGRWYRYWASPSVTAQERTDARERPASELADSTGPRFHVEPGDGAGEPAAAVAVGAADSASAQRATPGPATGVPAALDASSVDRPAPPASATRRRYAQARVLTVANQKGGVGKTTTAVSTAAALADIGCRVLLVDLDPQANATSGVGLRVRSGQRTVYDVIAGNAEMDDVIEATSVRGLFVVPSHIDLAGAEVELVSAFSREQKLRRALDEVRSEYDVILVDCPPSLGLLTVNALTAADGIIVPIQCEYYALEGLGALRRNAELIQSQLNPGLEILGFVMTMLDARTRLSQQVVDEVVAHFGDRVFQAQIPRTVRLAEAPSYGQPITVFDSSSRGAMAYRRLAREILERLDDLVPMTP